MDSSKFRRHFAVEGAEWFATRLDEYFCKMAGVPVGMLTLKDFREGGATITWLAGPYCRRLLCVLEQSMPPHNISGVVQTKVTKYCLPGL